MPWTFNPFSGTFDQKGSGGGSAFFAGEVATYADLPLDGTAALNSRWLVRNSSGTWPFPNYRQGGIYIRTSIVGASRDNDYTLADTKLPDVFADSAFLLYDNSDSTRNLQFDLGSITTGTTRTLTAPNASGRIQIEGQAIGNTTPAAGAFTTLTANNGTLTASAPVLELSQTWNNSAVAFTTFRINVTNTASLFSGSTSNLQDWLVGGSSVASLTAAGAITCRGLGTVAGGAITVNGCYGLHGPAGGVMEVRQGTTPIEARFYNTFTSATNHERGFLRWSSNVFQIGTEKGSGGGTARALEFQTDGVTRLIVSTTGLIQIGGASSAHVALKRNSNTLQIRTADDLGFGGLLCGALTLHGNLDASTRNIVTDTTTGTKIGTGTTQKVGFFNATPVVQQAAVADATDAASTQARLNDLLGRLRTLGLIAT
jgi:hypothetical protein